MEVVQGKAVPDYLIGLFCATAAAGGGGLDSGGQLEQLGSEAEILLLSWVVVDTKCGKVLAARRSIVQPDDLSKLSTRNLNAFDISTEDDVRSAGSLRDAFAELDSYVVQQLGGRENVVLVCDGQITLRQLIIPEAYQKELELPDYYWQFFDIRKEYRKWINNNEPVNTMNDILALIGSTPNTSEPFGLRQCHDLAYCICHLLAEGQEKGVECFQDPEVVKRTFDSGICERTERIDSNTVVRARGLPWQSSDHDVARFFVGLNIAKGGIALCLSQQGRRNGEALVRLECQEHRDLALRRHRHFMGNRYIEVYKANSDDFISVAAGSSSEAQQFLTKGASVIVRMRGLPYDCTAEKIIEFFKNGTTGVDVMDGEQGILFVNKADGRATGDAFVLFADETDGTAALAKHKEIIGSRYIELFRSTTAEVQQVINKSMEPPKPDNTAAVQQAASLISSFAPGALSALANPLLPSVVPQQLVIAGSRKDCIRLRGLPYEAQVQHILDFLGEYSKYIVFQGVHMVYNAQGHPSGEAFIQMDNEHNAAATAVDRHNKYMQIGKKQRYIEVFQCSADDMNLVLTGPSATNNSIPSPLLSAPVGPNRALLSPTSALMPGSPLLPNLISAGGLTHPLLSPQLVNAAALQNGHLLAAAPGLSPFAAASLQRLPAMLPAQALLNAGAGGLVYPYFPYPSPPMSPTAYYQTAAAPQCPGIILMRNLPVNATIADVLNYFQGIPDLSAECVQIHRTMDGRLTGDALITLPSRAVAERCVLERNGQMLGPKLIELYLCGL